MNNLIETNEFVCVNSVPKKLLRVWNKLATSMVKTISSIWYIVPKIQFKTFFSFFFFHSFQVPSSRYHKKYRKIIIFKQNSNLEGFIDNIKCYKYTSKLLSPKKVWIPIWSIILKYNLGFLFSLNLLFNDKILY